MQHSGDFDVIIAGGGYAGVMCAVRMAGRLRRRRPRIALVSPGETFVERLRLHEGMGRPERERLRTFDIGAFVGAVGVTFVRGRVVGLDRVSCTAVVETVGGQRPRFLYRRFVAAVGSANATERIPGAAKHAFVLDPNGQRAAAALHAALNRAAAPRITIIGAGSSGIELAAELTERADACVTLVTSAGFAPFAEPRLQRLLRRPLDAVGVRILTDSPVDRIGEHGAVIAAGTIPHDLCIVCAGFEAPAFLREAGLATSPDGRALADRYLRSVSDARVYAAGDACLPVDSVGAPARMSVMYALASGAHVADVIAAEIKGRRRPRPFGFWTYGRAIGLGRHAVGFSSIPHDRPLRPYLTGRVGYHVRAFFVWLLFSLLKVVRRWPAAPFWLGSPLRRPRHDGKAGNVRAAREHG